MTLEEARRAKLSSLGAQAETEYVGVFAAGGGVPNMTAAYLLSIAPYLRKPLSPSQDQMIRNAAAVVEKLDQKAAQVRAATTPEEVGAIAWAP